MRKPLSLSSLKEKTTGRELVGEFLCCENSVTITNKPY